MHHMNSVDKLVSRGLHNAKAYDKHCIVNTTSGQYKAAAERGFAYKAKSLPFLLSQSQNK